MITTRGRYAVRVLLDLAENNTGSYIPLKDIAARQSISKKYLEIIVKDMVAGGLLIGASGKGGGYRLSRAPEDYVIGEVLVRERAEDRAPGPHPARRSPCGPNTTSSPMIFSTGNAFPIFSEAETGRQSAGFFYPLKRFDL